MELLYEDEWLAAVDKPSGLLVAPDRWDASRDHLVELVRQSHGESWSNVHRLDRETSGVVLFAKSAEAQRRLTELWEEQQVGKLYVAITKPGPREATGVVDGALAADPRRPGKMKMARDGKPAVTEYAVVQRWKNEMALVEARPRTGRTHQIRVHLAELGAPVLVDAFYGDGKPLMLSDIKRNYRPRGREEQPILSRLALHAFRLTFVHPWHGGEVEIESPLPRDMARALDSLDRYAGIVNSGA